MMVANHPLGQAEMEINATLGFAWSRMDETKGAKLCMVWLTNMSTRCFFGAGFVQFPTCL